MRLGIKKEMALRIAVPLKKIIIFESNPPMSGNVMPVYKEMLRRHVNDKYKLIWFVDDKKKYEEYSEKNIEFIDYAPETEIEQKKKREYLRFAKAIVFENRIYGKTWKNQFVINLMHGMPIKSLGDYQQNKPCDFIVTSTQALNDVVAREMNVPKDKIIALGYPRADALRTQNNSLSRFDKIKSKKVILWMPTFRKHSSGKQNDGKSYSLGVPLIESNEDYCEIDEVLRKNDCTLVIKLHPAESTVKNDMNRCSNIVFLTDLEIKQHGISLYELIADTAALITDYSSVYFDYLLTERSIGLVVDDIKEYESSRGFAIGNFYDVVKGNYIYCKEDLKDFIRNVAIGSDPHKDEMMDAKRKYAEIDDYISTERVTNFILEKMKYR